MRDRRRSTPVVPSDQKLIWINRLPLNWTESPSARISVPRANENTGLAPAKNQASESRWKCRMANAEERNDAQLCTHFNATRRQVSEPFACHRLYSRSL